MQQMAAVDLGPAARSLRYFRFAEYIIVYAGIAAVGWAILLVHILVDPSDSLSSFGSGFSTGALLLGVLASLAAVGFGTFAYFSAAKLRSPIVRRYGRLLPLIAVVLFGLGALFISQGDGLMEAGKRLNLTTGLIAMQGYDPWTGTFVKTPEMEAEIAAQKTEATALVAGATPFIFQGTLGLMIAIVAIVGLLGLTRFRFTRITKSEKTMRVLDALDQARQAQVRPAAGKPVSRTLGVLFLAIAIAVLIATQLVFTVDFASLVSLAVGGFLGLIISVVVFICLFRAKQYLQIAADSLLGNDKRPPILFLRSFSDDPKVTATAGLGHEGLAYLLDLSLETRLANHFMDFGPFIAVGSPQEKIPQIGAARVKLSDEEWQNSVTNWMQESSAVVLYAGTTKWVSWELQRIIEGGWTTKLILLFPPVLPFPGFRHRTFLRKQTPDILNRFEKAKRAFKGTVWEAAFERIADPQSIVCMTFQPSGEIDVTRSARRSKDAYELAAAIAHARLIGALPEAA